MQRLLETLKQISKKVEEIKHLQGGSLTNVELNSLSSHKFLTKEEELTEYINKIFEQQERERIVRWIVNSIRESLDLKEVLNTTVEEVGKLLKVERCLIALFNRDSKKFDLKSEYRINEDVKSVLNEELIINKSQKWYKTIVVDKLPIIIDDLSSDETSVEQTELYRIYNAKSSLMIPIIHKNEILGIFSIQQLDHIRKWELNHVEILKDIGSQIAIAIRQAELYLMTKKQADRERILRKIISTIRSTFDVDEILKIICEEVATLFDVERTVIVEYSNDKNHKNIITRRKYTIDETIDTPKNINFDKKFVECPKINLISGTTIEINNIDEYEFPDQLKQTYELKDGKSALATPIKKGGKIWGTIVLVKVNKYRKWTEDEISLLETIADQVYLAIQQAEFYITTKKQADREKSLRKIISTIRSTLDTDKTLQAICDEIAKLFNVDSANIVEFLDKETHIEWKIRREYKAEKTIAGLLEVLDKQSSEYIVQNYYLQGQCFVINDLYESDIPDFLKNIYKTMGVRSVIASPIKKGEKVWGAIGLLVANESRHWTEEEINLLETITDQIYIAIQQAELFSTTKKQAEREALLRNITEAIRSSLDIDETKRAFITEVGKTFGADRCFIGIFDKDKDDFYPIDQHSQYLSSPDIESFAGMEFDKKIDEYMKSISKKNMPTIFPDVDEINEEADLDNIGLKEFFQRNKVKSTYGFTIFNDGRLIGTFVLQYIKNKVILKKDEIELLKTVTNQAGIAIKQAELYLTTKKQADRESSLRKGITAIRSSLDIDEVLNAICNEISRMFKVQRVSIGDFKGESKEVTILAEYNAEENLQGILENENTTKTRKYWIENLTRYKTSLAYSNFEDTDLPDYFRENYKARGIKSIIGLPIKKGDEVWGGLFLSEYSNYRDWTEEETDLLMAIADQVSIAISQASLYSQTQQATRLKSEFLANMSHEFRTPLNAIIGFSEMLLSSAYGNLSDKQSQYLNNIAVSGKHLLRLVNDILDLSKIESGNMDLHYEIININDVINESIAILKDMASKKNIFIDVYTENIPISADVLRFKQIMYNLLSNAIKFTKDYGKVTVRAAIEDKNLRIEVEDTGIGISSQNRNKIFSQFSQVDSSYARKQEGTGLGLVLTKKLIEMHGGSIDFKSEENVGTTFWFILPLESRNS